MRSRTLYLKALTLAMLLGVGAPAIARAQEDDAKDDLLSNEGWTSLFDGKSLEGFDVEGVAKVEDGKLLLGSDEKPTTLTWKQRPASFDIRFEFANERRNIGQFEIATVDGTEAASTGMMSVAGLRKLPDWNLLVARVRCEPGSGGSDGSSEVTASGEAKAFGSTYATLVRSEFLIDAPDRLRVRWTVPKNYRLALRNVYVRERQIR